MIQIGLRLSQLLILEYIYVITSLAVKLSKTMYNLVIDEVVKLHKEWKAMYNQSSIGYKIVEDYV